MTNHPESESRPRPIYSYIVLAGAMFAFIENFRLISPILLSFLLKHCF